MTKPTITTDIVVIGGGSGGLSVAAGAVQMGAKVVLVECGLMGGDCLNYGCVPSKAILSAAKVAHTVSEASNYGIEASLHKTDMAGVAGYVRGVIDTIAPHDSVERFTGLGVKVIEAKGKFISPNLLQAGNEIIQGKYFVIATGSTAFIPPIPKLSEIPYFTNHNIFDCKEKIDHLLVIGGGPIGLELAQAYRRLGSQVSVIEMMDFMAKDDRECAEVVLDNLREEGIALFGGYQVTEANMLENQVNLHIQKDKETKVLQGSHLLVAAGRRAVLSDLGLEDAKVDFTPQGICVNESLRTSNRRIFAIGDVIGGYQFTHTAGYHAGIIIRQMLFRIPAKASLKAMPWVTYTDPELAHIGESYDTAVARLGKDAVKVISWKFHENDRAIAEGHSMGMIKVVTDKKGKVLGVDIVGRGAGELLLPWQMLVSEGGKIGKFAGAIAPYPTRSEISKRVAGQYYTPFIYSEKIRKIVRFLLKFA